MTNVEPSVRRGLRRRLALVLAVSAMALTTLGLSNVTNDEVTTTGLVVEVTDPSDHAPVADETGTTAAGADPTPVLERTTDETTDQTTDGDGAPVETLDEDDWPGDSEPATAAPPASSFSDVDTGTDLASPSSPPTTTAPSSAGPTTTAAPATSTTTAAFDTAEAEAQVLSFLNGKRQANGLSALPRAACMDTMARDHAEAMKKRGSLSHRGDLIASAQRFCGNDWTGGVYENVAYGPNVDWLNAGWWKSAPHRENMLRDDLTHVGIGVVHDPETGRVYGTVNFWARSDR